MENPQDIRKWSELHNLAVVSLADGKKVGTWDDFYFEPDTHHVYALRVKTGMFGHKVLPVAAIRAIGQDALTTTDEEVLESESKDERASTLPFGQDLQSYKVMSISGTLVGIVRNVLLDISTPTALQIAAFELTGGLRERLTGHYPTFPVAQVVRYGRDLLVISDEAARSLQEH
jgi:uncharacterized protein YrrD